MDAPPSRQRIDLSQPRFDQSTFVGRLKHFVDITDVRNMFISQQTLDNALLTLKRYQNGEDIPEETVWAAKKVKDSIIHPQTNEKIFFPGRLSCFVPLNTFITAGMLLPNNPTLVTTMFWQWMNQKYNVVMNHSNRNASNVMSNEQITKAYLWACGTSCGIAGGLGEFVKRLKNMAPATKIFVQKFVPFVAVSAAGIVNVFLMRANEMTEGIEITDENGKVLEGGRSPAAGTRALSQTALSRLLVPFICLTIPPLFMSKLEQTNLLKRRPMVGKLTNLGVIVGTLFAALPLAIALFPQQSSVPVTKLEPRYHNLRGKDGKLISTAYYNKGL